MGRGPSLNDVEVEAQSPASRARFPLDAAVIETRMTRRDGRASLFFLTPGGVFHQIVEVISQLWGLFRTPWLVLRGLAGLNSTAPTSM